MLNHAAFMLLGITSNETNICGREYLTSKVKNQAWKVLIFPAS